MKEFIKNIDKITIIGAGISGRETAKWAVSAGKQVSISETKPLSSLPVDFTEFCRINNVFIETGGHSTDLIKEADLVVASPGVSPYSHMIKEIKRQKIPLMGELDLAIRLWDGPVIGITGTNGKTTTTSLLGRIFEEAGIPSVVGGNIGKPLIGYVAQGYSRRVAILEASSFQIDYFSELNEFGRLIFNTVAITNITPDHIDRYGNFENYAASKLRICDFLDKKGSLVINSNLIEFQNSFAKANNIVFFGDNPMGEHYAKIYGNNLFVKVSGKCHEFDISKWRLKGKHNLENLSCAAIIANLYDIRKESIQRTINNFKAPAHRIQFVERINDVDYYNDSKATNVSSVIKAIDAISNPLILIAGGRGKGENYMPLRERALLKKIKKAILVGEEAKSILNVFEDLIPVKIIENKGDGFETFYEAVREAKKIAEPGDAVLLSPACASFDMFNNYEERGEAFIKAVKHIKESL